MSMSSRKPAPDECEESVYRFGWSHNCGRPAVATINQRGREHRVCKLHQTMYAKREKADAERREKRQREEADHAQVVQAADRLRKLGVVCATSTRSINLSADVANTLADRLAAADVKTRTPRRGW